MKREIIGLAGIGVAAPRMAYDYMWWAVVWVGVIGRQSADANPAPGGSVEGTKKEEGEKEAVQKHSCWGLWTRESPNPIDEGGY